MTSDASQSAPRSADAAVIFTTADANYLPGALVTLYSALQHCRSQNFVLVTSAPGSPLLNARVFQLFENEGARLQVIDGAALPRAEMKGATSRFPPEAFMRYYPEFLPTGQARTALYLDSDILVIGPLDMPPASTLGGKALAVAPDLHAIAKGKLEQQCQRIGLSAGALYYCSGVLLIDIERYTAGALREKLIEVLDAGAGRFAYPDQDALNLADRDSYAVLDPRFNFPPSLWRFLTPAERRRVSVIHFYDGSKPWGAKAHRLPSDILAAYDAAAAELGVGDAIRRERSGNVQLQNRLFAPKFWIENLHRRHLARRAIAEHMPV